MTAELITQTLRVVDAQKLRLDALRPLPTHTESSMRDKLALDWTYHSNAIEGNTLTLRETKVVLEGIAIGGKSMQEHFEAINHNEAIRFVEEQARIQDPLATWQIQQIHSLILKNIRDGEAGRFRHENVAISGASATPPDYQHLAQEIQNLMVWHESALPTMHPVVRSVELHTRFVKIHPFIDGNGRTGRLLLNLELMKAGYPPAVIRKEDRVRYYDVLDEACVSGCYDGVTLLVAEALQRSLDVFLYLIEPRSVTN
ncbi:Fic family protein [Uliginosibacterium gangwonense]|uniref:Fic family protein n=1 Tax=Uliginosibacterium gangwonense TaxID=392736 RepID=UPI00036B796E|nr:Fic family protein [Uliginosibacterium gangwonense]